MDRAFLIGEKIYLRPFDIDDLEGNYLQWVNDGEIIKHLASNAFPKTKEDLSNYVNNILSDDSYIYFAVKDIAVFDTLQVNTDEHWLDPRNWSSK